MGNYERWATIIRLVFFVMSTCRSCSSAFEITQEDLAFYEKVSPEFNRKKELIPSPTLCPDCRLQRRLAWCNERHLYHRKCDLTGRQIISIYSPDKPFTVYDVKEWWTDKWSPYDYGRDIDWNKPFFEQMKDLMKVVPRLSLYNLGGENENSDYTNDMQRLKNCYLTFDGERGQDSFYGETFVSIKDSCEFLFLQESELCYECTNCFGCYNVRFSSFSNHCSDSLFLLDCNSCKNCIACCNLQQKEYCIFNQQYTKEEYENYLKSLNLHTYTGLSAFKEQVNAFLLSQPRRAMRGINNENASGDNLLGCKNAFECYDAVNALDSKYCCSIQNGCTDCYDVSTWGGNMQLCYENSVIGENASQLMGCFFVSHGVSNLYYSVLCSRESSNLFGCYGIKHGQYCILNKQYTKEEYEALVPRIIELMRKHGEWGEFFPGWMCDFGYNETRANEYFPMSQEKALEQGWNWHDEPDAQRQYLGPDSSIPDNIDDVQDDICNQILLCETTGKPYKIVPQELRFYRNMRLPLPRICPNERHRFRMELRNPRHLWNRECMHCKKPIQTSYSPDRSEIVYCDDCYFSIMY
jgi:hypothetical protein